MTKEEHQARQSEKTSDDKIGALQEKPDSNGSKSVNGATAFPGTSGNENLVTGKVCDVNGNPVIGACVLIEGTTVGSVTDLNGTFKLGAPKGAVLSVSYVGMQAEKIKVKDADPLTITLKAD